MTEITCAIPEYPAIPELVFIKCNQIECVQDVVNYNWRHQRIDLKYFLYIHKDQWEQLAEHYECDLDDVSAQLAGLKITHPIWDKGKPFLIPEKYGDFSLIELCEGYMSFNNYTIKIELQPI